MTRHVPRGYPSQEIAGLPRPYLLPAGPWDEAPRTVAMSYLSPEDVPAVFAVAQEAAHSNYNVGSDEFSSVEDLRYLLSTCEVFVFRREDPAVPAVVGALLLQPSMYSNSWRKHTCCLRVLVTRWLHERGGYPLLLDVGGQLALEVGLMYDSVTTTVFLSSLDIYTWTRDAGFAATAVLPFTGYTAVGGRKPQRVALFYKSLGPPAKLRPLKELIEFCNNSDMFGTHEDYLKGTPLKIPYLPLTHTMKNGNTFLCRNYEKSDDRKIYDLILKAISKNEGYSIDEYPSINCLRNYDLMPSYCVLLTDKDKDDTVVGFMMFGGSRLLRSADDTLLGDVAMYIEPGYRGRGTGGELTLMAHGMMKDAGFKGTLSEIFMTNHGTVVLPQETGLTMVGFSSKCVHTAHMGWIDCVYIFKDFSGSKGFLDDIHSAARKKHLVSNL